MRERNLPDGWEWKKLGEVGQYINGKAFKPSDWTTFGKPIIRIQNLTNDDSTFNFFKGDCEEKYLIKKGDILISWSASLGVFVWTGGDAVLNQHIFKAIPNEKLIDRKFFVYVVRSIIEGMKKYSHGSTMKHIVKGDFDNSKIPLPPLPIQHYIVAMLERAGEVKRQRQDADMWMGELLQSIFYDMFGDTVRNERGWKIKTFREIAFIKDVDHRMPQEVDTGIPLISPKNFVENDQIDFKNAKKISEKDYQRMCKKIQPRFGDIIYSRYGTICEARLVPIDEKFQISYSLCIIRPTTPDVSLKFLFWLLKMPFVKKEIAKKQRSSCIPDLGLGELNKIKIPLPPLALQQQFVSVVQKVERIRERQTESKREIDLLFAGLMTEAFSGKLPA